MAVSARLGVQRMALCVFIFSAHLFDVQLLGRIFSFLFLCLPAGNNRCFGLFFMPKRQKGVAYGNSNKASLGGVLPEWKALACEISPQRNSN
jgi:hypothetical protein